MPKIQGMHIRMSDSRTQPQLQSFARRPGINSLIQAANTNDRFHLLEDESVLPGDLDNTIHAIFYRFDTAGPMRQALRLASHFLEHDTTLAFFVPLLYGRELKDPDTQNTYLSDPLASASSTMRRQLIQGVRDALQVLARRLTFSFIPHENEVYGRTLADYTRPYCNHGPAFQGQVSAEIEITDRFSSYYTWRTGGYITASRCAQFRHDFLFATTLVHEIVHAFGILRRGNLIEPYYRPDYPETEWGYAWENFMFGSIINPQDRTMPGTTILMRKVWDSAKLADKNGGKEYCDVDMAWVGQWFQAATWHAIEKRGLAAIEVPFTHFKIQVSPRFTGWVVTSSHSPVREDVRLLEREWRRAEEEQSYAFPNGDRCSYRVEWRFTSEEALQKSNVVSPVREPKRLDDSVLRLLWAYIEGTIPEQDPTIPKLHMEQTPAILPTAGIPTATSMEETLAVLPAKETSGLLSMDQAPLILPTLFPQVRVAACRASTPSRRKRQSKESGNEEVAKRSKIE